MTKSTPPKDIFLGLVYSLMDLVYYCYCGKHGRAQMDVVLERELRVLYLNPQAARTPPGCVSHWAELEHRRP